MCNIQNDHTGQSTQQSEVVHFGFPLLLDSLSAAKLGVLYRNSKVAVTSCYPFCTSLSVLCALLNCILVQVFRKTSRLKIWPSVFLDVTSFNMMQIYGSFRGLATPVFRVSKATDGSRL